jgi:NADPH-dependent 7-cyano-7-deazaguanine reductase QueF-like protein
VDAVCSSIIRNSYKEKLGITKNSVMHFQLGDIFQSYGLSQLDEPFSIKEIEAVVKEIPTDFLPVLMVSMGCS